MTKSKIISFVKSEKFARWSKICLVLAVVALVFVGQDLLASTAGNLQAAGGKSKNEVQTAISGWMWVMAFAPFVGALFIAYKVKEYYEAKDEQAGGQTEPKVSRYMKIVGGFIGGVLIFYILYGVWGMVFANSNFSDMWNVMVVDFWGKLIKDSMDFTKASAQ